MKFLEDVSLSEAAFRDLLNRVEAMDKSLQRAVPQPHSLALPTLTPWVRLQFSPTYVGFESVPRGNQFQVTTALNAAGYTDPIPLGTIGWDRHSEASIWRDGQGVIAGIRAAEPRGSAVKLFICIPVNPCAN